MTLFNLLFLLIFTAPSLSYSQTCRSLLQSTDYSTYKLSTTTRVRPASMISDSLHNRNLMNDLSDSGAIVLNQDTPYARTQYYGTCYIYAGIGLLENELINAGLIEPGDLLLAPSILVETAKIRVAKRSASNLAQLLDGGFFEIFHSTHGKKLYVLPKEEVKKLGKLQPRSNQVLTLENVFLETTLDDIGSNFQELSSNPNIGLSFTNLFMEYLQKYTLKKEVPLLTPKALGPLSFNYTSYRSYRNYLLGGTVDTDKTPEISQLYDSRDFEIKELDSVYFDDDSLMTISQKILENKFVFVVLTGLFSESHSVLLTNTVVDHDSKSITGFIMLDSSGPDEGLLGSSYISVAELKKYLTTLMYLNEIRQN